jgi:LacI family transcriptional regulator
LNHFSAVFQSLVEMSKLGYRRIGFAMERMRERVEHRWKAAHLMFLDLNPDQEGIPALEGHFDRETFLRWFDKYRPTAILSQQVNFTEFLFREGLVCGRDYGFATLARDSHDQAVSELSAPALRGHLRDPAGIDQNSFYTGRFAVEFLAQEIAHNIKGPPRHPKVMLINGDWHHGKTLPQNLRTESRRTLRSPKKSRS